MKPVASVMFEGTLTEGYDIPLGNVGKFKPDARAKMQVLSETHHVIVVSGASRFHWGPGLLITLLSEEGIPFDEVWAGDNMPDVSVRYDNEAKTL